MVTFGQYVLSCHLSQSFIIFQSNVLRSEGHCYLSDFGISKLPTMSPLATFAQRVHRGWAAPELDEQTRSKQSDIFSFACTIYEVFFLSISLIYWHYSHIFAHKMFTQKPPYDGSSSAEDRSKLPMRKGPLVHEEWNKLWEILELCWSADLFDRPTASDLEARLPEIAQFLTADASHPE